MDHIKKNLDNIANTIESSCIRSNRHKNDITLVAVSKTFPCSYIEKAHDYGQMIFGENKVQEAESKISIIKKNVIWHFIGRIQRNKVAKILNLFSVIESVDSLVLASYINSVASKLDVKPDVYLQVNLTGELSKGGFDKDVLIRQMADLLALNHISIVGLMGIPPNNQTRDFARRWFAQLRMLRDDLECEFNCKFPTLSMGMSNDYDIAIEEGATSVRIGSALFGDRSNIIF